MESNTTLRKKTLDKLGPVKVSSQASQSEQPYLSLTVEKSRVHGCG